jgi:hypothetical protein
MSGHVYWMYFDGIDWWNRPFTLLIRWYTLFFCNWDDDFCSLMWFISVSLRGSFYLPSSFFTWLVFALFWWHLPPVKKYKGFIRKCSTGKFSILLFTLLWSRDLLNWQIFICTYHRYTYCSISTFPFLHRLFSSFFLRLSGSISCWFLNSDDCLIFEATKFVHWNCTSM